MPERQPPQQQQQRRPRETSREPRDQRDQRYETNPEVTPQQQLARVTGTYMVASQANQRLQFAAREYNLVSPATAVGALPEGCGIALNAVFVHVEHETYNVGTSKSPKHALSKSALDRVAASIGVSWAPDQCVRCDDGSDPHYCHFRVAGYYRAFDGQVQVITGNKEMDLRDGSPAIVQIEAEVDKHNKNPRRTFDRDKVSQIRQLRSKILEHAETKAKLRAIRSLGVRASYTPDELARPFVCARIMFTGQTSDPELRRMFAAENARAFLSGTQQLYGGGHATPHRQAMDTPHAPPPVGSIPSIDEDDPHLDDGYPDDDGDGDEPIDTQGETVPNDSRRESRNGNPRADANGASEFVIPGGRNQGTPLHLAEDGDLQYWADRIGRDLDANKSRNKERDAALHQAMCDEIALREQGPDGPPPKDGGSPKQQELKT